MTRALEEHERVRALLAANGEEMSQRMNLWVDHIETATPEQVLQATKGTYYIEIKVNE